MAVFTPACFSPCSGARLPTECICRDTINVTFADCLLAFYLNGIQLWRAAGSRAAAVTLRLGASRVHGRPGPCVPRDPGWGDAGKTAPTPEAKSRGPRMRTDVAGREVCGPVRDLRGHDLEEISSGLRRPELLHPGGKPACARRRPWKPRGVSERWLRRLVLASRRCFPSGNTWRGAFRPDRAFLQRFPSGQIPASLWAYTRQGRGLWPACWCQEPVPVSSSGRTRRAPRSRDKVEWTGQRGRLLGAPGMWGRWLPVQAEGGQRGSAEASQARAPALGLRPGSRSPGDLQRRALICGKLDIFVGKE